MTKTSDTAPKRRPSGDAVRLEVSHSARRPFAGVPPFLPGTVWLTGAGPGDPSLLTLQALSALEQADVIFHDALVSETVLDLAPPETPRVFVGKRGGRPSPKQPEITARLIEAARSGKRVVRLKGGDPMVFGRGAEEAIELAAAGIPFRIVSGISAAIGGLSSAGIPVTHRDFNQALTLVTAHDAGGGLTESLDWDALAKSAPVLVIFMGYRLIGAISSRLIAAGRPGSQPVAIISRATAPDQQTIITTLATAERDLAAAGLEPPVMIVVGEIVRLRAQLDLAREFAGAVAAAR